MSTKEYASILPAVSVSGELLRVESETSCYTPHHAAGESSYMSVVNEHWQAAAVSIFA